ncbi:Uncharacterised protein [Legionella pneumophila]|uniref:hypothetical protein n=1 Tax=Legionella pneumophila TaxID=446 RepID=UPI0005CAEE59|nr:hypothetical protein [Legionella pneumophila]HAT8828285.1 hypothetical protein [Legionella pneumophila subsp. pneumophila]WAI79401.1 hypothetical protein OXA86_00875 [Legionella pneumophila]CZH22209.1 Uncharacterised protein [Legionella pneumophila]CZI46088.1 Uncharacterised protein [Legionella pneumophila]HAT4693295.1 hypothetical protein [Legionella pneumophila]
MRNIFDDIRTQLPPYLSAEQKKELFEEISKFPNINYFTNKIGTNELLQGDGWSGLTVLDFPTGNRKQVKGVILSNTCDIDVNNSRDTDVNIIFAPLVKLDNYTALLRANGVSDTALTDKIKAIKQQQVTSIMYIPKIGSMDVEYIINFDDIHSQPLSSFVTGGGTKLFTLSQSGFYVLLLKISIHFCRFQEGIVR